jgi:hypothetical protein
MQIREFYLLMVIIGLIGGNAFSQNTAERYQRIDYVIEDLYDVISGPAGERDWDRMRNLFHDDALMGSIRKNNEGELVYASFSLEEYIKRSGPYFLENGFFESEISSSSQSYGELVHRFSAYESRHTEKDPVFSRGINSIQLVYTKNRWWIVSIQWNSERDDLPLPKKLK